MGNKKRATLLWTITSHFLMDFNTLCTNRKMNKYSTLRFTYLVVPHWL